MAVREIRKFLFYLKFRIVWRSEGVEVSELFVSLKNVDTSYLTDISLDL